MKKIKLNSLLLLILVSAPLLLTSCREDDPTPITPSPTDIKNAEINEWILENMEYWYFWEDELVAQNDKSLDPAAFFESILYTGDRFSWIQDNYQELLNSLKGVNKEAGFEFVLYRDKTNTDNVIAQIQYVKPGSPAESAGLLRGDVISHINDQLMTIATYKDLVGKMKENYTIRYKSIDVENETYSEEKTVALSAVQYSENPNFMHKVIETNGRKIGYYVYNLFAGGPTQESKVYDNEMDAIFADFKAKGVTDLVLDLRFNSGGSESSSNNLASNIGTGVNNSKVFARKEYNSGVTAAILNDDDLGADFLTRKFTNKTSNIGSQLTDNRVYILTSKRSASASELVINALKPYMDVFIVGDTTYGKNVGSISLYDEENSTHSWGMQPIVVKIYNSLDQSDYSSGFIPNLYHKDNKLFVYPLGDPRELLLGQAIGQITGTPTSGRASDRGPEKEIIGHSLDLKRSSYNLTVENFPE